MSDTILVGLISGVFGVLIALIPIIRTVRKGPSRITTDAVNLVDASGEVISNLTQEIDRLETRLTVAQSEADHCCGRIAALEYALMASGIDPKAIT